MNWLAVCLFCPPVLIVPGENCWLRFLLSVMCSSSHPRTRLQSAMPFACSHPLHLGEKNHTQQPWGTTEAIYIFAAFFWMDHQTVTSSHSAFFSGSRLLLWTKTCVKSLQLPSGRLAVRDLAINYRSSSPLIQPHGYSQDVHLQENETGMLFWLRTFWAWLLVHVRPCAW